MPYQSFAEVYAENDRVRERLIATVGTIDNEVAATRLNDEGWSVAQIVEHISIVDEGMGKICSKLLSAAREKGLTNNGSVHLSPEFIEGIENLATTKLEAPERVHPISGQTVAESLTRLAANRERLNGIKSLFEKFDSTEEKFPHPHFGDLSAAEWLVLLGGHEARHIEQIERIITSRYTLPTN